MNRLIDTHHHLWDTAKTDYPWMTAELDAIRRRFDTDDLLAVTGPAGVTGTILVQTRSSFEESQEFLAVAADTDLILGVVAWVDLSSPDVFEQITTLKSGKGGTYLVGIRHQVHDEEDENWLLREDVQRGLSAIHAQELAYDLLLRPRELPAAIGAVRNLPDMHWVLDHIAKPEIAKCGWQPWADHIEDLAKASPTCWVKLSGMATEADWNAWTIDDLRPYANHIIKSFGPQRCMLGSDWPVCLLAAPYRRIMDTAQDLITNLPADQQADISFSNAIEAYRLEPDARN
ncbi:amidohydrolase family protein [Roseibium album]|uniref:Putative metal-dependent hydrolase of the TIM-barrel fold protein n=1 Tax=Roseibium album TaxID=311410 RepID=A0A0M6ZHD9_9HYPH|nr:amidohydrolase family protein [Roseibium album]CTQ61570.1 putative metal-dependent hydrolase of the TIM-barrel fold protein [Roseibium album]CTQ75803.1 putative metal-dependent hydrolase of the TIM-barrel fold protein [Roseibium album]CTQ78071.1 putative metal-dependent hydrolase of the TIM-barrel fold protein [Roseibium album]